MTGKGGVGKTTVAAALGLAAARAGKRTLVCEVAEQERITTAFGHEPAGFSEVEVAPDLSAFSINPEDAKQEWLRHQLRSGAPGLAAQLQPHLPVPHRRRARAGGGGHDGQDLGAGAAASGARSPAARMTS